VLIFFTKGMTGQVMGSLLDASYFDRFLVELVFFDGHELKVVG
jgi:hypothetical protein